MANRSEPLDVMELEHRDASERGASRPVVRGSHGIVAAGHYLTAMSAMRMLLSGGNAFDAAAAAGFAAAVVEPTASYSLCTEVSLMLYDSATGKVQALSGQGVAPKAATVDFFRSKGLDKIPTGPGLNAELSFTVPGVVDALLTMLERYGTKTVGEVMAPALEYAESGFPMYAQMRRSLQSRAALEQFHRYPPGGTEVFYPGGQPLQEGELLVQAGLAATMLQMVEAAGWKGGDRQSGIRAAKDVFYRGDIAEELVAATRAAGGLFTLDDLDQWKVYVEDPVSTSYKDIEVYKLNHWVQGPVMLQTLNILEDVDLKGMGYNSAPYMHALYQAMNLSFADRDFYYGDPYFPPAEPIAGLLSKDYARDRRAQINWERNDPRVRPGDPYPYQGETNPFADLLESWQPRLQTRRQARLGVDAGQMSRDEAFLAGTTSIQAADADGWVVSITPSGGWVPAFIAGDTGVGLSQRMQSFDMDPAMNPFNVVEPGKRPRATLSPGLAMRDGRPYLSFAVQGGDTQDQNLLQLFLNVVEFGMDVQQAAEAANINSYQMHGSVGASRIAEPGRLVVRTDTPAQVVRELRGMGYAVEGRQKTSGPINAIFFDQEHGTLWGGSSDFGDDYGIAW